MKTVALLAVLIATVPTAGADEARVAFPEDYRQWRHVKSMVILPGHPLHQAFGGVHHIYANPLAVRGYASGRFPDGAVIVFDLLEATSADDAIQDGPRKVLGVMQRDARAFSATGGWGYEGFVEGDRSRRVSPSPDACYACHTSQKDRDYVFSRMRK